MLGSERQREILALLRDRETIRVKTIVERFYVSEATARRDLAELERSGAVRRVFGGAALVTGSDRQVPLFVREREDEAEKQALAARAAALVRDGDVLFLDGSSTVQCMVRHLAERKDLVVITNGLKVAAALAERHIKVYCTGGLLVGNSSVLVGAEAERFADRFNTDLCFLSCKGLSADGKLTDTSEAETELRRHALASAKRRVLLLTASKLGRTYLHTLCPSTELDEIVTSVELPDGVRLRA